MSTNLLYAKSRPAFKNRGDLINPYRKNDLFTPFDQPTFSSATMNNESIAIDNSYGYQNISDYEKTYYTEESQNSIYRKMAKSLELDCQDCDELPKLFKVFFGKENIRRLQSNIKQEVLTRTQGKFKLTDDQELNDLLIWMRAIYIDHAKNLPKYIVKQTKVLNEILLKQMMPDIVSTIKQQYGFIKDITQPREIMRHPMNVNSAGRKQLPSITTLWNV